MLRKFKFSVVNLEMIGGMERKTLNLRCLEPIRAVLATEGLF